MQISTNERLIKKRSRLGAYASLAGLGVLVVGTIVSFRSQYIWVTFVAIIIGVTLAQYGSYSLRRWGRSPRPDQVLTTALKGFDDRYHFYAWSLPAPYVLLSPQGIYSFTTRDQTGQITVTGSQWHHKFTLGRVLLLFAQEGLGNPTSEALDNAERMIAWIKSALPDVSVAVNPVIVFIAERAQLQITAPAVPVLEPKGLKKWLRGAGKGGTVSNANLKALEELFNGKIEPG
ncbi:MAG: hypothetical protein CVU38_12015 [Chloroflexi bacterium HGW-Chloroflexi-1]|nr:MAG: hypothetical protein CVU38_12015 [Chloroflexi bacterium HGW-Chloroflexi-1]